MLNSWAVASGGWRQALGLLCLTASLVTYPAWAGKYAYGEQFVRSGQSWGDALPPPVSLRADTALIEADAAAYTEQLASLELTHGPYSEVLAEPLASLGQYYRQQGDLEQAMRLYRRALHVVRINDGLYSERQMPILRELLDAYRITGDLEALDGRYEYYYRLYGQGQPPFTDVRVRATLAYLRWQREAVRLGVDAEDSRRLLALYQLNEDQLLAVGAEPDADPAWYRELVLSQLRNLYLLEDRFAPTVENMGITPQLPIVSDDWKQEDFNKRRLETLQRGSLSHGARLMQELIARTERSGDQLAVARLRLELGDWYQWHASERRAGEQYRQVVALLTAQDRPDLLKAWLGQPVELPDNGAFWQPQPAVNAQAPVVVQISYDVSARGRVRNMESSVADPEHEGVANRIRRKLGQIRFRPRWINGEAEAVSGVSRPYQLTY